MKNLFLVLVLLILTFQSQAVVLGSENFSVETIQVSTSGERSFNYYKYKKAPEVLKAIFPNANRKDRIVFHKFAFMVNKDFSELSSRQLKDPKIFKQILKLNSLRKIEEEFIGSKPLALGMDIGFKYTQSLIGDDSGDDFISKSDEDKLSKVIRLNNLGRADLTLFQNFHYFSNIFKKGYVMFFFYAAENGKTLVVSYASLLVKASTANSFLIGRVIKGQLNSRMKDEFENLKENRHLIFE